MDRHVNFGDIAKYLREKIFPNNVKDKGKKSNFRKACKEFSIVNGQLMYKESRRVIMSKENQHTIIHDVHVGLGEDSKAKAMSSHRGRDSTQQKIAARFYWHNIKDDVKEYIKKCDQCQKHGNLKKVSTKLHSIPVINDVMQQIGVDVCNLPEVDGFKHLIVCIDYFTKWSEAKPTKDNTAPTIAQFLYDIFCRHGCVKVTIAQEISNPLRDYLLWP